MHRCPEYIIGVRITYFFELHNAIKSWTKYFNGQTIFLFCGNSLSFFVVNRFPICCTNLKKQTAAITKRGAPQWMRLS